jgi:ubiquinone/menaquinone biosynthesis C-methylase UbiE
MDVRDPSAYGQPSGGTRYREVLSKRASGELPEMESSKAVAKAISGKLVSGDSILDVGCGVGHYLVSLDRQITAPFSYTGVDASQESIEAAKKVFAHRSEVSFERGDIFALPYEDNSFDLVMANNVLLHLPQIETPLRELLRVAKRHVWFRTLIGDRSFRIKDIHDPEDYDQLGGPSNFAYYNIYSSRYVGEVLARSGASDFRIWADTDFDPERISNAASEHGRASDATRIMDGKQVNGYIILPWSIAEADL